MNNCVIELTDLNKSFSNGAGNNHVLKQVNFSVHSGEMVAILGPIRQWEINFAVHYGPIGYR